MNQEIKATLIMIFTTMLAGVGWLFSKQSIAELPPFAFIGIRFLLGGILLLPFCRRSLVKISHKQLCNASMVGVLMSCALLTWITAISVSDTLSEGAFISSLAMLFVPLITWALFKQAPPRIFWLSLPFAVAGLAMLSLSNGYRLSASQLWFLAAAVLLALHFVFNSKYSRSVPTLTLACIQLFVVGIIATVLSICLETWPTHVGMATWIWVALSIAVSTSMRYVVQTFGQKMTSSGNAAIIMILEPVWTSLVSIMFYHEAVSLNKFVGCSLILSSLFIYRGGMLIYQRYKNNLSSNA